MRFKIHSTGYEMIAGMLAGSGKAVDGMLVELDTPGDVSSAPGGAGNSATVPVRRQSCGATVTFTGLVRAQDFGDWSPGRKITRATVMCGNTPVASSLVVPPVELPETAYTAVSVDLKFCDQDNA